MQTMKKMWSTPQVLVHGDVEKVTQTIGAKLIGSSDTGFLDINNDGVQGPNDPSICTAGTNCPGDGVGASRLP